MKTVRKIMKAEGINFSRSNLFSSSGQLRDNLFVMLDFIRML
ncbi:MAG: hypothetical protein WBQ38_02870 [Ignavibacteria bacterium]